MRPAAAPPTVFAPPALVAPPAMVEHLRAEAGEQHRRREDALALTAPGLDRTRHPAVLEHFLRFFGSRERAAAAVRRAAVLRAAPSRRTPGPRCLHLGRDAAAIAA